MTPDRLVDFIPSVLAELLPPTLPENPGNAAALCRWLEAIQHQNETPVPTGIRNPLWPLPPSVAATRYTLVQTPQVPQLHLPAGIPLKFCNYPGQNFRGELLPPLVQCCRVAEHVIAANGELAFVRTDFELPGPFPFRWQRFYRQSADAAQGLGCGWRHTLSESLQLPEAAAEPERKVILHTADGRSIAFDLPAIGQASFNRCERLYLLRQSLHSFRLGGFAMADKIFRADGTGHSAPLSEIRDACGNTLSVDYRNGQPHRIITSWGRTLEFVYDGGQLTRIVNTHAVGDAPLCNYHFDEDRQLLRAEAGDSSERYAYENGQLRLLTSPTGTMHFAFDRIGRCHRLQHNALELELHWQPSRRLCTLSSGDQHDIHWQFDERGDLIREQQEQRETRFLYDHYRNLCLRQDADGRRTLFRHDEFGRLLRRTSDGRHQRFAYDPQGRLLVATTSAPQTEITRWIFRYGEQPHPSQVTDPAGQQWRCEYDERGQLRQLTDPESGRTILHWDGQSQLTTLQRGDSHYQFDYDPMGRLNHCSGHRLPARHWRYDTNGALLRVDMAGSTYTIARDEQHRPCAIDASTVTGTLRLLQWQCDERNLIRHVRFANGSPWNLDYNRRGQLSALTVDGSEAHWQYDRFGRLQEFTDSTGRRREWLYGSNGRVREYRDSDNHWYLEYRADGALEKIRNNSGQHCHFHFDDRGRLLQASNNDCDLRFRYDSGNRLIAEHHDINLDSRRESLSINYDYDARGWLRTSASDSINTTYIFAASGALYGMDTNGEMLLRSELGIATGEENDEGNDDTQVEHWTLGKHKVTRHFTHGLLQQIALGDRFQWHTATAGVQLRPDFIVARAEAASEIAAADCDRYGNIVSEVRTNTGERLRYHYQFNGWGLMHSAECGDFSTFFRYDPFGRRLAKTGCHSRSRRQRRVSSYWTGIGLWQETSRLGDNRTTIHYLHHPLENTPLARLIHTDEHGRGEGKTSSDERHFYLASSGGQLLAVLNTPDEAPLWHRQQEPSANNRGPGTFRGSDGILDSETQLYYRDFSYWHTADGRVAATPLDAGQCRLLVRCRQRAATMTSGSHGISAAATADDESVTNPPYPPSK
ncbi:hypothetical protein GNX18_12295 [Microbulbifer sp. SH-1]|nr:hypothetical protein GNX18_12295 [Microbulbifer sp. SH-1]